MTDRVALNPLPDARSDAEPAHAPPGFLGWLARLVRAHRRQLVAYARGMGLDGDEALDCVQDAFCSFMELPQAQLVAEAPDDAIKLLTVILRHIALNRRKTQRRRASLLEVHGAVTEPLPAPSVDQTLSDLEQLARVHGCILRMRALQRQVVSLCLLEGRDSAEVAEELNVTAGYARVLLLRARQHIRSCDFSQHEPVPWQG